MDCITTTLFPAAPFNFELTAGYHTYFRGSYGTDSLEGGEYRRLLDLGPKLVLTSVRSIGSVAHPELQVQLCSETLTEREATEATQQVAWLLGTDQDLTPFYNLAHSDPVLSQITERFYGLHLPHTASVFEAVVLAILGQQIATNVARIIRTLLIETYGPSLEHEGEQHFAFPRPEALAPVAVGELRKLKLSQRKAEYVQGFAQATLEGFNRLGMLQELPDAEVVKELTGLRGIGHWTAQWVLVRALGRPDALPLGDLALRRVVSNLYFRGDLIDDNQLAEFAARWSPYRTYATVYLFSALRNGMGQ
ncbi:MAG: DNA-3-methyladenine glycosylase family protein [Dehalococcoidia bacterium]